MVALFGLGWSSWAARSQEVDAKKGPPPEAHVEDAPSRAGTLEPPDTELPPIEAKPFATNVNKRSQSQRVYLLEAKDYMPHVGRIVLLKRESENVMAFRVIRTYEDKKQFAARRVKEYGGKKVLPIGDAYLAIEKLRDLGYQATPEEQRLDDKDLKELEQEKPAEPLPSVNPYDEELDSGTSPPPRGAVDDENAEPIEEEDDNLENLVADEVQPLDPDTHSLPAEFGELVNVNRNGGTRTNEGGGMRYGLTIGKLVFLSSTKAQDAVTLEAGAFLYKLIKFESATDAYTIVPLVGTVRYNILFSEDLSVFFYAGLMQNLVLSVSQGSRTAVAALSSTLPAAGGGLMFRIGPKWHIRADLGLDMIAGGLVLRF